MLYAQVKYERVYDVHATSRCWKSRYIKKRDCDVYREYTGIIFLYIFFYLKYTSSQAPQAPPGISAKPHA